MNSSEKEQSPLWGVATIEDADKPLTTRSAGNLVRGEFKQNKRSAQWAVAPIELADEHSLTAGGRYFSECEFNRKGVSSAVRSYDH